ncbi:beta strand repeat-containing protein [Azospirillum brasilense]|nr:filamentous hemagglutinin N-terminal domain-containing protein [Azospirillum brasilense]
MRRWLRPVPLLSLAFVPLSLPASAQIATDGTAGPKVSLSGGNIEIGASLGTPAGGNLFHSFDTFNVNRNQTVTFTGPDTTRNVISRVTGSTPSAIDGTLRSTAVQADVYLINPAGVVFGPEARLDVPGAFHASTAHELRFADGTRLSALDKTGSSFTTAPPQAFGFLNRPTGALRVDQSRLSVKPGKALSLVGGDVEVRGGASGRIEAPGGTVTIASAAGAGDVRIRDGHTDAATRGKVRLTDRARIMTTGDGGGAIRIRGGALVAETATLSAGNTGPADATGGIDVQTGSFDARGSAVISETTGTGKGAPISLRAGSVTLRNGTRVASNASGQGAAGPISVETGDLSIVGTGTTFSTLIESNALSGTAGPNGTIAVAADRLTIRDGGAIRSGTLGASRAADVSVTSGSLFMFGDSDGGVRSRIVSESLPMATGSTGSVAVAVRGPLELHDTAQIASRTEGSGNAGPVTIQAGTLSIFGANLDILTGIFSQAAEGSTGTAGTVDIRANGIDLFGPTAQLSSNTLGKGDAGFISVRAGTLSITGNESGGFTGILSNALEGSGGNSGSVSVIVTNELAINRGSWISGDTFGTGNAGSVSVQAGSLSITGVDGGRFTGISSTAEESSTGHGGKVNVTTAGHLAISHGGEIDSSTFSFGDAGNVTVQAGSLSITGNDGLDFTGIASSATRSSQGGNAGTVNVTTTGHLAISRSGEIASGTFSLGNAGNVTVQAQTLAITGTDGAPLRTGISSVAERGSLGGAGTVNVTATGELAVSHGGEITSSTFSLGDAGNVTVQAGSLSIIGNDGLDFNGIASNALIGSLGGHAGTVNVTVTGELAISHGGEIASDTFSLGNAGNVIVQAGSLSITGTDGGGFTGIGSGAEQGFGNAGTVSVTTTGQLAISHGGEIRSSTFSRGNAGSVTVQAGSLSITGNDGLDFTGIASNANRTSRGHAGTVNVTTTGELAVSHGGEIASDTFATGNAGSVTIQAGALSIMGNDGESFTGISSNANRNSSGHAGTVDVTTTGPLALGRTGEIASSTFGGGDAGNVIVRADTLTISGIDGATLRTGIGSVAEAGSLGSAGTVSVTAAGELAISHGGEITSGTFSRGNAGDVVVQAGSLSIAGNGGLDFTGISSNANRNSSGQAGTVDVTTTGPLSLTRTGEIASNTFGDGDAGNVLVRADTLTIRGIDGATLRTGIGSVAEAGSLGSAGTVSVTAAGELAISHGGEITSGTFSRGNAGDVAVQAGSLSIAGNGGLDFTGISSNANRNSSGHAGTVETTVTGTLDIRSGGEISSSTFSVGDAGSVTVRAGSAVLNGGEGAERSEIATRAWPGSLGAGGAIEVHVGSLSLGPGSAVVTQSDSPGDAGNILIDARDAVSISTPAALSTTTLEGISSLRNASGVSSAATGGGNAGRITVGAGNGLRMHNSLIDSTSTFAGGGQITLNVGRLIDAEDSRILSTVAGDLPGSDAGDISINSFFLVLDNARIQANAKGGNGGDVRIGSDWLIQTPDSLITATSERAISGNIVIEAPDVDIGSTLVALPESYLNAGELLRDTCSGRGGGSVSSLTFSNGGGLPLDPAGPLPSLYAEPADRQAGTPPPLVFAAGKPGCR